MDRSNSLKRRIDEFLELKLFELWMLGRTPEELVHLYKGTEQEFSRSSLFRAMNRYKWNERRENLLKEVHLEYEHSIKYIKALQLKSLNHIISFTIRRFESDIRESHINPDATPSWLPKSLKELGCLFRTYEFVISDGKTKNEPTSDFSSDISDEAAKEVLRILAEDATKRIMAETS